MFNLGHVPKKERGFYSNRGPYCMSSIFLSFV
jgi:hypothetical protein